ncbi:MAG: DEAD/DEAH box helicase family protein [Nanoarchaeota archaeon]
MANALDKLFGFLEEQNPILFKEGPPRPGLVPQSGDYQRPFRWIRPKELLGQKNKMVSSNIQNFLSKESLDRPSLLPELFGLPSFLDEVATDVLDHLAGKKVNRRYIRKDGGGEGGLSEGETVAVSSNPGIFTPTYDGNGHKKKAKLFKDWIQNAQVAHHDHDGFKEHPVAVKNHQEYFSGSAKQLPYGENLDPSILKRFYAAYKLRQSGNLDATQKEFVENMIGGVSDDELKEFFSQQYGGAKKEKTYYAAPKRKDLEESIDKPVTEKPFVPTDESKKSDTIAMDQLQYADHPYGRMARSDTEFFRSVQVQFEKRGYLTSKQKEVVDKLINKYRKQISTKTEISLPETVEEIDSELQALGRARVRPWGSKDLAAQNNISDRIKQLQTAKDKIQKPLGYRVGRSAGLAGNERKPGHIMPGETFVSYDYGDPRLADYNKGYDEGKTEREKSNKPISKFQDFINTTKSDLSSPWFGKTYADVFGEYPVTEISIDKSSRKNIIATPMKDGKFDAGAVPSGAAIWITITATSSPLAGRHVLIQKLPDGRFSLVGGAGMSEATEARRHLILGGSPKKTTRDTQLETEADAAEALNEPLRVAKKEVEKEARVEIKKASDSMLEALGIKKLDKDNLLEKKEEIQKFIESELGEEGKEQAKRITDTVMRHFIAAEREIKERVQAQRQVAITRVGKRLASLKDVSEIAEDLPDDIEPLIIDIPSISNLTDLTSGEQELAISRHFGDQVDNFFSEEPIPASTSEILGKKEKLPTMELGATIEPLKLESVEQLRSTIDTVKNYWDKRSEAEQIKSQIRKVTKISAIPSTISDLQKTIAESGVMMSMEEIEQKVASDQNQWMRNERTQSFYDAVGDFWNDDKSLEETLNSSRNDTSMYRHISSGAATALAALSQQYGGAKLDTKKLLEASNIEVGAAALALNMRIQYQKDAAGYDKVIQDVQTFNANNQTETERKALERHGHLKSQFAEIQRQKEGSELLDKIRIATLESDLLLEQRKNLGAALGSMQASAAFLDSLSKFRGATNDVISINVGKNVDDAYDVVSRLKLKKGYTVDTSDPDNVKINVGISRLDKLVTEEKGIQSKADKYEKIKTDMSGVSEDEEGRLTVDKFDVPGFKKEFVDEAGKTQPYKWRVEQRNDINWLMEASKKTSDNPEGIGGGLITRVTGAGKTNTAYGFFGFQMKQNPDYKALAIVPKGRVQQWVDEAKKFTDLNIEMIPEGLARDKVEDLLAKSKKGTVYVMAHREAARASDMLQAIQNDKDLQFGGFVVDEPQELQARGQSGNIGEMGRRIFKVPVKHRIALTATPARRNPVEAYDLIRWSSGSKELGTKAFFKRVFSGFGSGTNAQDTSISDMFFKTVQPYISGDRLTTPNFKVKQESVAITRSPEQIQRQKEIEAESAGYIAKRREEISNEVRNNPGHSFRRSHTWETRLGRYANDTARKEVAQMHRENFDNRSATTGAKMVALKNELKKGLDKKQVIYIDSSTQRHSLQAVFEELGLKQSQIKNIASGVTSMTGEEMTNRARAFQKDPNVKVILIDRNSSTGFNLQQGSVLHVVGTPDAAATLMQAQGRIARMPRTGDVEVKSYRYQDNPSEASLWNDLDNQIKVLRASSPGMFVGA